ncbi:hypothetical protein D8674_011816 [Pyrus ussuriensis x Pyrus communis]|uniref:Uncharacterized protein n=1 Tax=Pyrus ussuriensis x Pyrus communis TaxID=2448454 RepID=A0A5N5FZT4_9ROSA|nr:hypothetical protein D8674_011816 [Pyrus ussuriensis x Pyrus communis]
MVDGSFTTKDHLQQGRPPLPLGPSLNSVPLIDPSRISQCCIECGLFPTVSFHFEFSCSEATSWAD